MKFKEVELKYSAENISLKSFKEFCFAYRTPLKTINASGYDYFYNSNKEPFAFCRHRVGPDMNQLTFKRKLVQNNNNIRTEHNLDLKKETSVEQVKALCEEFGYSYNTQIFKTCFVYIYDYYTLVYYICYDSEMKECGRFFEIEAKEDYGWQNETEAWDAIVALEKMCKTLGVTAQGRIKKSLFEMYRK